ncbi:MAG: DUF1232 domain-containing protein [Actinobacteria bacterium]|nr:DUF1232 domain-containing protein [Actinomycetota bacterium]
MSNNMYTLGSGDENFEPSGFLKWAKSNAKNAGMKAIEKGLMAFHVAMDPKTPTQSRVILYSALAYLVLPVDAVPDFIPVAGFTDDLTALTAAIIAIASNVKVRHLRSARERMNGMGVVIDLVPRSWRDDAPLSDYLSEAGQLAT